MSELARQISAAEIEQLEARMLAECETIAPPVTHHFAPGVYVREMAAKAGTFLIGHAHNDETINIVLTGKARVYSDGQVKEIAAPFVFKSGKGVRKIAVVVEDMRWLNVHGNPDNEQDMDKLEARYITKSQAFLNHQPKDEKWLG